MDLKLIIDLSLCFIDCQSTGSNPATADLLELAFDDQSYLLQTSAPISKKIQSLTGITPDEYEQAISRAVLFTKLSEYLALKQPRWIVAHFARFEKSLLDRLWQEHAGTPFPYEFLCTYQLAKRLHPDLPTYGLRAVSGWYGDTLHEHKRALDHVHATQFIWQRMISELAERGVFHEGSLQEFLNEKPLKTTVRKSYLIDRDKRLTLPDQPGVYRYIARNGRILYVGKATSLKHRVNSYFTGGLKRDHRKREMLAQAADVQVTVVSSPLHAGLLEYEEIQKHQPPYNKMFRGQNISLESELQILLKYPDEISPLDLQRASQHVFYGVDDLDVLKSGLRIWQETLPESDVKNYRFLVRLGLPLLKEWIAHEKQKLLEKEALKQAPLLSDQQTTEDVDSEETELAETEEIEFVWTPELIADAAKAWTRRAARDHVRKLYLRRLRQVVITQDDGNKTYESRGDLDDRQAKVLIHELRRAETKGQAWHIVKPWPMHIPFWI